MTSISISRSRVEEEGDPQVDRDETQKETETTARRKTKGGWSQKDKKKMVVGMANFWNAQKEGKKKQGRTPQGGFSTDDAHERQNRKDQEVHGDWPLKGENEIVKL